jgi:hypothetical protein
LIIVTNKNKKLINGKAIKNYTKLKKHHIMRVFYVAHIHGEARDSIHVLKSVLSEDHHISYIYN